MKYFFILLTILSINEASATQCEWQKELQHEGKSIHLCYEKEQDLYLTLDCKDIKECFLGKKIKLQFYANQSPGFSLCYQLGGKPFFGKIINQLIKIPMCSLNKHVIDQENLMKVYFSIPDPE